MGYYCSAAVNPFDGVCLSSLCETYTSFSQFVLFTFQLSHASPFCSFPYFRFTPFYFNFMYLFLGKDSGGRETDRLVGVLPKGHEH